jgi:CHAD domain-containing protein
VAEGKWIAGLSPGMPVADAARVALAARLEVVRQFLPLAATRPYEDAEYVHQLRVGTRRAAAALRVFADCLPRKRLKAAKTALRAIRQAAGDARDWDVFLKSLSDATPAADPDTRPAFDFLLGYALGERSAAQARLVGAADAAGPDFAPDTAVLPAHVRDPRGDDPPATFGDLAFGQLTDLFERFNADIATNPSEPAALHQLRILGKRVRYAMELFATCFAPPLKDILYPAIEALQEALGDLQDAAVGSERLEGLRARVRLAIPDEWPRLEAGIDGLLRANRDRIPEGRGRFAAWRADWARLTAEHPLAALRLGPGPTPERPGM